MAWNRAGVRRPRRKTRIPRDTVVVSLLLRSYILFVDLSCQSDRNTSFRSRSYITGFAEGLSMDRVLFLWVLNIYGHFPLRLFSFVTISARRKQFTCVRRIVWYYCIGYLRRYCQLKRKFTALAAYRVRRVFESFPLGDYFTSHLPQQHIRRTTTNGPTACFKSISIDERTHEYYIARVHDNDARNEGRR